MRSFRKHGLTLFLLCVTAGVSHAGQVTLADTNVDYGAGLQGSGAQGTWQYGVYTTPYNPSTFTTAPLTYTATPTSGYWLSAPYVFIGANSQSEPQGDAHMDISGDAIPAMFAVRRWTSNYTGTVTISGYLQRASASSDELSAVLGQVYEGTTLLGTTTASSGNTSQLNYSFTTSIVAGDAIDFMVGLNNINHDDTSYSTLYGNVGTIDSVTATPEPSTIALAGGVLMVVGFRRLRN